MSRGQPNCYTFSPLLNAYSLTFVLLHRLFYTVGVGGYLYAYNDTRDNILLNFPLSVKTVLIGRIGYGVTIMFGMPLVFLPCRAAILSLQDQIQERREAMQRIRSSPAEKEETLRSMMKGAKHHVANSVTFDEECPLFLETSSPKKATHKQVVVAPSNSTDGSVSGLSNKDQESTVATLESSIAEDSYESFVVTTPLPSIEDGARRDWWVHVSSSLGILVVAYITAVGAPGVGVVWSIAGSSMAIIIGFIIPAACYLKIRSKKSINPRSIGAAALLIFSVIASVVCTVRTIKELYQ